MKMDKKRIISILLTLLMITGVVISSIFVSQRADKETILVYGITIAAVIVLSLALIGGYYGYTGNISYFSGSIITFCIFLIGVIAASSYYTISKTPTKFDPKSENRMGEIDNVMSSYLGMNWSWLLMTFAILLFVILVMLYLLSRNAIIINVNPRLYSLISLCIGIIFSIVMISLAVIAIIQYNSTVNNIMVSDDKAWMIASVIVLLISVIVVVGGFVFYIRNKKMINSANQNV